MTALSAQDQKILVSKKAMTYVKNGALLGLGSGTTALEFIKLFAKKVQRGELRDVKCVSTGPGTDLLCQTQGIELVDFNTIPSAVLDVVVDGADEYTADGTVIKGGGACLLYEKILAYSTKKFILLVDDSKLSKTLNTKHPIPIEVIPMAHNRVKTRLEQNYSIKSLKIRMDERKVGPVITREGNFLLDLVFANPEHCDWTTLEHKLKCIVGVVESGLFTHLKPTIVRYTGSKLQIDGYS